MTWDEPQQATSPRGWISFEAGEHPQTGDYYFERTGCNCCGFYLQYDREDGLPVLASEANLHHSTMGGRTTIPYGQGWFATPAAARDWIESTVRARALNA